MTVISLKKRDTTSCNVIGTISILVELSYQALIKVSSLTGREKAIMDSKKKEQVHLALKSRCRLEIAEPLN